ncbi:class I SAM-dependent methyltransferase [Microbacterium album]|uniref:16S RNA G1207 methylase RsmC n=1 Tax=Microbacterium album TaxID=2053191 RepID=A0A917IEW0_9MICO|nr:methyltransferase [Microbacterium album]GGH39647.1 16S RNA G1207 methylase RsmC [Microbacterium album]
MSGVGGAAAAFDEIAPLLRRRPDVEAHDLVAADASDRLILAEAAETASDEAVVIGDRYGALTLALLRAVPSMRIRLHQDAVTGEHALRANAADLGIPLDSVSWHELDRELVVGSGTVVLQLPRSLDALDEIAGVVAADADDAVRLVAGGRVKHMTLAMNDVLARHFADVRASRAASKSRVLHAARPIRGAAEPWPRRRDHPELGITVCAHGAAFAGTSVDIGTRFLLEFLPSMPEAGTAIDLACGTGVLATALARLRPRTTVIATDQSAAAVSSARATAAANGVGDRVRVVRDDGLAAQPDASADLILLNPPFHSGAAVTAEIAPRLFADAARVLRPGGELWCVFNSHLGYRPVLERVVGPTGQAGRNPKFTVTVSTRR